MPRSQKNCGINASRVLPVAWPIAIPGARCKLGKKGDGGARERRRTRVQRNWTRLEELSGTLLTELVLASCL